MQKKGNYLILVLVLFLTFNVKNTYASEVNLTSSKNNANVGENIKVKVSFTAAGWNLVVKDNNNTIDNIAGVNPDGNNELVTKEYTIDTSAIGTHTITVSGDITDENENKSAIKKTITIVVNKKEENNITKNNNHENNVNTNKEVKEETIKEKNKEEQNNSTETVENKENSKKKLTITKFEIVGYNVKFNVNKKKYLIDILENTTELYVIIEGDNIEVSQQGKINIKNKDLIEISISNQDVKNTYKIKLNRVSKEKKTEVETKDKSILFILILVFIIVMTSIIIIVNKIKKRRREI